MEKALFIAMVACAIAYTLETSFHTRVGGNMKRGIRVWSELLSENARVFLLDLHHDIVERQWGGSTAFIQKREDVALVHYPQMRGWKPALCVGYVDLQERWPRIQYRVPFTFILLGGVCFVFLAWATLRVPIAGIVCMVGLSLVFLGGFRDERRRVVEYLARKMVGQPN